MMKRNCWSTGTCIKQFRCSGVREWELVEQPYKHPAPMPHGMVHHGPANHPHLARQLPPTRAIQQTAAAGPASTSGNGDARARMRTIMSFEPIDTILL